MKNKHYNIFFTSENDGLGKSFRISKALFLSFLFFFSGLIIFASIGVYRVSGADSISARLDECENHEYVMSNLLVESGVKEDLVKSKDLEKIIIDYMIMNNLVHPSDPPVDGYVTRGVTKHENEVVHAGISIASKNKDEIKSPLGGIVIVAEENNGLGGMIILSHKNNFFTFYKNLDSIFVSPRDLVQKDEIIAESANINEEGSHLYFEVWKDNQVIDPRSLISDYKEKDVSIR